MYCMESKITEEVSLISCYISCDNSTFQELLTDDDTRDISHLLKDNTEYIFLVLEFIQSVRLLQLRETQFKEIVRSLKGCIQEKVKLKIYYLAILFRKC